MRQFIRYSHSFFPLLWWTCVSSNCECSKKCALVDAADLRRVVETYIITGRYYPTTSSDTKPLVTSFIHQDSYLEREPWLFVSSSVWNGRKHGVESFFVCSFFDEPAAIVYNARGQRLYVSRCANAYVKLLRCCVPVTKSRRNNNEEIRPQGVRVIPFFEDRLWDISHSANGVSWSVVDEEAHWLLSDEKQKWDAQ